MQPSDSPDETRQQAQTRLVYERYQDEVEPGPESWQTTGIEYFVRKSFILVPEARMAEIRDVLRRAGRIPDSDPPLRTIDDEPPSADEPDVIPPRDGDRAHGVYWIKLNPRVGVLETLRLVRRTFQDDDLGAPELMLHIAGEGGCCPADEPTPVAAGSPPDPAVSADRAAGTGIRVVVLDTGFDGRASALPWLRGVTGQHDPGITGNDLLPYAGHGTFIAGVVRSMAPAADVVVLRAFRLLGVVFEKDLVRKLGTALRDFQPDVINLSGGTTADCVSGPYLLNQFYDETFQRYKGVAIVSAAGNDGHRKQFWPAASPWAVSVGALAADWRTRADFSNFGGWVDLYAPGEHLVNAFPTGNLVYQEPPLKNTIGTFTSMASWSGTSFAAPIVAGLIAARMSYTGENGIAAAAALVAQAQAAALPGVGAVLLPSGHSCD